MAVIQRLCLIVCIFCDFVRTLCDKSYFLNDRFVINFIFVHSLVHNMVVSDSMVMILLLHMTVTSIDSSSFSAVPFAVLMLPLTV